MFLGYATFFMFSTNSIKPNWHPCTRLALRHWRKQFPMNKAEHCSLLRVHFSPLNLQVESNTVCTGAHVHEQERLSPATLMFDEPLVCLSKLSIYKLAYSHLSILPISSHMLCEDTIILDPEFWICLRRAHFQNKILQFQPCSALWDA